MLKLVHFEMIPLGQKKKIAASEIAPQRAGCRETAIRSASRRAVGRGPSAVALCSFAPALCEQAGGPQRLTFVLLDYTI